MRHTCAVRPEDLGPFLLGHLEPDEAELVAEAIESCATCSAEVARLRPVARALSLGTTPREESAVPAPSPALDRVLAVVQDESARRRRRVRRRVALAAAAVLLAVVAVAGLAVAVGGDEQGRDIALTGQSAATGTAVVSERGWGTAISLRLEGLEPGRTYGAWLADRSGERTSAGTFRPTADGSVRLDLAASLLLPDASVLGVTEIDGDDVLRATLHRSGTRAVGGHA
jgi:anti-sigma factor RsiW